MKPIRVGVVGYGRMGRLRASVLESLPKFDLVAVCETDQESVDSVDYRLYDDFREKK